MEYNIAWEIFTVEEVNALKKACQMGLKSYLTQCVVEMNPQKEIELQKLAEQLEPTPIESESGVLKQFTLSKLQKIKSGEATSTNPESPEEEAELQKLLDEEQLERQKKFSSKSKKQSESLKATLEEADNKEKNEDEKDSDLPKSPQPKWKIVK